MDQSVNQAFKAGDQLLSELSTAPARPSAAPTMGRLQKVRYTHEAMIDFIIEHPAVSQGEIAAHFGFTPAWISNILASDAFQNSMAARKEEIIDPTIKATVEERMRALYIRSLEVLQAKLSQPAVSDTLAIRAAELGARGLGLGAHAVPPPAAPSQDRLVVLADRLVVLNRKVRGETYEAEVVSSGQLEERV